MMAAMTSTSPVRAVEPDGSEPTSKPERVDRRTLRRQQTIEEILDLATEIMTEEGVNGLSLSEVARRLGVQPPSIYKYFPSLMAIYDALFMRGQVEHLDVMRNAMATEAPGLIALRAGLEASGRWAVEHRAMAQLLWWRPVPSFEPSAEAFEPSRAMVQLQRDALAEAVAGNELGRGALDDDAVFTISVMIAGVIGQAIANEPGVPWGEGRFSPLFGRLFDVLPALYPPTPKRRSR
jgi:AcrR family transcriptional regulator